MNSRRVLHRHQRTPGVHVNAQRGNRRLGVDKQVLLKVRIDPGARNHPRSDCWRTGIHIFDRPPHVIRAQQSLFDQQGLNSFDPLLVIGQLGILFKREVGVGRVMFVHRLLLGSWLQPVFIDIDQ